MQQRRDEFLFEVSWEVCNKVGGIYTVLASKARTAVEVFGENYYVLGPDLKRNPEFEETDEDVWNRVRAALAIKEIPCRFGRWTIPGRPKAILVDFGKKYNKDQLLFNLWEDYGVDSIAGHWDYVEPVMFSYACGEVIETIYGLEAAPGNAKAVAQFHEWMCGAGLLRVKKHAPAIATVFTTHATVLGRALAGSGRDIYTEMETISPQVEARNHNVSAKYSMEAAVTREADCFTTVSEITAGEARSLLGRNADVVTPNGLDLSNIPDLSQTREPALEPRRKLLDFASRFLGRGFPPDTRIMIISGRYEFHNKGIDVFLDALKHMEGDVRPDQAALAFFCIMAGHKEVTAAGPRAGGIAQIATHRLDNEAGDPILNTCNRLGLRNSPDSRISVIFVPAFLTGYDGALNMPYYTALSGSDLGVFPSYYEPWGYTPLESAAYAVPTISTDQAGFGLWARHADGENSGVLLLNRQKKDMQTIGRDLQQILRGFMGWSEAEMAERRKSARHIALKAEWADFYAQYLLAYDTARTAVERRMARTSAATYREEMRYTFVGIGGSEPHFRAFTAEVNLPENISRLRDLAYNLWWVWHPPARGLFSHLDPKVWGDTGGNPVATLKAVSPERLQEMARDEGYMALYSQIVQQFGDYMKSKGQNGDKEPATRIRSSSPVAYFSMEYGLHECLPIYSGGLGVLSGDHLKSASDLNVPLVAVGLLYRNGYFRQKIDKDGRQIAEYPENDFSNMPVQLLRDERGGDVQISLDVPGRTLHANIWEVKVGRVSLYLLDTDTPRNTVQDRKITSKLYSADPRIRIEQEVLLGMGGIRLLRKLGIRPSVYHMNEGHSAFLLLELIQEMMTEQNLSFDEAKEAVRAMAVFTSHTPVDAGHERFERDLAQHYFETYVQRTGITWAQFWELGRRETGDDKPFFMTMLGLKLSHMRNAVSRMHAAVSHRMWQDAWKGFHFSDVPITYVTNGVHIPSFVDSRMADLLNTYLGLDWNRKMSNADRWKRVQQIPASQLWQVRCELRQRMTTFLRENVSQHAAKYSRSTDNVEEILSRINPSAMWIGFARRFAPYKRADLILSDLDRLDKIVNNEDRPVQIVFGGKAHPEDKLGIDLLQRVIAVCNDKRFRGRVFFVEDYDLRAARLLQAGVDVWLNTPRRPYEASGTSGQKVVANGVLNLSISDGWWCEGYDGTNGWTIGAREDEPADPSADSTEEDSRSLYGLIEEAIVPLYFKRDTAGIPQEWLAMAKRAMQSLAPRFNTERMLREYIDKMYLPAAERAGAVSKDGYRLAREIADWKRKIPTRFSSLRIIDVSLKGTYGDTILVGKPFSVHVRIDPGKLEQGEILVELLVGKTDGHRFIGDLQCIPLTASRDERGMMVFSGDYEVRDNGRYSYGIRVIPFNKILAWKQEAELVLWG